MSYTHRDRLHRMYLYGYTHRDTYLYGYGYTLFGAVVEKVTIIEIQSTSESRPNLLRIHAKNVDNHGSCHNRPLCYVTIVNYDITVSKCLRSKCRGKSRVIFTLFVMPIIILWYVLWFHQR